ncbi:MAG: class I SAM-dependent methyltransferase [Alphaproteobacteria bacterium]|nr:class I SAM-dependent methyltransferase [Alphaproteobacteria bacterium]
MSEETTHFGFRDVPAGEKAGMVGDVFRRVARRYDLMNDLMSLGVHRLWKAALIDRLAPRAGEAVLDIAGGTGDIAFAVHRASAGHARVMVCDINEAMLGEGVDRAAGRGLLPGPALAWIAGDAETLPLADASVDAVTIAFGLRNVTHIDRALAEARRVLVPGGRFFCLEFSRVVLPGLDRLYDAWSFGALPRLGAVVARDRAAYEYLVESIRRFPPQAELLAMMAAAGLARNRVQNLSGGIAAIHSGWRL